MKKFLMVIVLFFVVAGHTESSAKDTKKKLEDRVAALEAQVELLRGALNGPVSDGLELMDERTRDLNERLHKYELNQGDDKASARR